MSATDEVLLEALRAAGHDDAAEVLAAKLKPAGDPPAEPAKPRTMDELFREALESKYGKGNPNHGGDS